MCYHRNGITSDEDNKSEQADSNDITTRPIKKYDEQTVSSNSRKNS